MNGIKKEQKQETERSGPPISGRDQTMMKVKKRTAKTLLYLNWATFTSFNLLNTHI